MCGKAKKYNIVRSLYIKNAQVSFDAKCNGWTIKNIGNTLLNYEGEDFQPQQSFSVGGNFNEVYMGKVDIFFKLPTPAPAVPKNAAIVTQKVYIDVDL